jgi:TPR repeat protein
MNRTFPSAIFGALLSVAIAFPPSGKASLPKNRDFADLQVVGSSLKGFLESQPQLTPQQSETFEARAERVRNLAATGNASAQIAMAYLYSEGLGVPRDPTAAVEWCRKAADQGSEIAQTVLGEWYDNGTGVKQDEEEAVRWYRQAAARGYAPAKIDLGLSLTWGTGVATNHVEALRLFKEAWESNNPVGAYQLGMAYKLGRGTETDAEQALKWFLLAAEKGLPEAQAATAAYYYELKKDDVNAAKWAGIGMRAGNPMAEGIWACLLDDGKVVKRDLTEAMRLWKLAAENGNASAAAQYGSKLIWSSEVATNPVEGIKWVTKAAEQDIPKALCELGICYDQGIAGVAIDHSKARELYLRAADRGSTRAMLNLGKLYSTGQGVKRSESDAFYWCNRAAENGSAPAQALAGTMLLEGQGTAVDISKGISYLRAASDSEPSAQTSLGFFYVNRAATNVAEGVRLLTKAAEAKDPRAMLELSRLYLFGRGVGPDKEQWWYWLMKAYTAGLPDAVPVAANAYLQGTALEGDKLEVFSRCRQIAEAGFPAAQLTYATLVARGLTSEPQSQAVEWFRKAAENAAPEAAFQLGMIYAQGILGTEKNANLAAEWIERAAQRSFPPAEQFISDFYKRGQGVPQDLEKSHAWLVQAAKHGQVECQYQLGLWYSFDARPVDLVESAKWLKLAALGGHRMAKVDFNLVKAKITPDQLKEADTRLSAFLGITSEELQRRINESGR